MNAVAAILLVCTLINAAVAGYVFWRRHTLVSHFVFAAMAMVFACWNFSDFMIAVLADREAVILWGRLAFALASLVGFSYVLFSWHFPETHHVPRPPTPVVAGVVLAALGAVAISLSDLVQSDVVPEGGHWRLVTGPFHGLFVLYMLTMFGWGTVNLLRSYARAPVGRERMQLSYTLVGFVLTFSLGYTANFVGPLFISKPNLMLLGGASPTVWSVLTCYAIVRYRLMDIGIPLRASAIHAIVVVALAAFFVVPMTLFPRFEGLTGPLRVVVLLVLAVAFALIVEPLHEWAKRVVDKHLFGGRYDYEGAVVRFGDRLSYNYDRRNISQVVAQEMPILFRSVSCAVYLNSSEQAGLRREAVNAPDPGEQNVSFPSLLPPDMPVIRALMDMRQLVHADALERLPRKWRILRSAIEENLHEMGALVAVPILSKTVIHGVAFLGERTNDNIYTKDELQLARTLVGHAALALDNAALFDEQLAAKRHYETILRHMQRGLLSVSSDLRIRTLNLRAAQILGLAVEDWIGKPVTDLNPRFEDMLVKTIREKGSLPPQEQTIEVQGRQFPCECETSLLRDGKGAVAGAALVFQDLTERKKFEAEVRRVDRLASVGTLAAGLAHEIKNPLVAIQTFTQLLPERYDDSEFRDQFAAVVINEVTRINDLVHNMLNLARPRNEIPAEVQIHDVLDQVLALISNQLRKHNIALHQHLAAHMPPVCCSVQQMHQVFLNLLQNAVEAMAETGGDLTLSTAFENGGKADNGTTVESSVRVVVQDTGCGMTQDQIQRIFDPFFSTKAEGSGLGLSNCLSILKEQGANIAVESALDAGSTFTLTIPLVPPSRESETGEYPLNS